jgi:hypothetical protein
MMAAGAKGLLQKVASKCKQAKDQKSKEEPTLHRDPTEGGILQYFSTANPREGTP